MDETTPPAEPETGRPVSAAGVLESAAKWLDIADRAFALLEQVRSQPAALEVVEGKSVQADLRMLAAWLREHPAVDASMRSVLDAYPAR